MYFFLSVVLDVGEGCRSYFEIRVKFTDIQTVVEIEVFPGLNRIPGVCNRTVFYEAEHKEKCQVENQGRIECFARFKIPHIKGLRRIMPLDAIGAIRKFIAIFLSVPFPFP